MQRQRKSEDAYINFVNFILNNELNLRDAVEDARQTRPPVAELRNESALADPTAYEAINNLMPVDSVFIDNVKIYQPELWLETLDEAYKYLKRKGDKYYRAVKRFFHNHDHYSQICADCYISPDKFYETVEKFRQKTISIASYNRLVKPF